MIGQVISQYKVLEKLGEGGMGIVYKAQDTKLNRFVALKFLPPHLSASDADKARFMQEAQAAAALNHPNICTIYGIDEYEGQMFIAMEFVDGQTLNEKKRSLSFKQAIDIGIQIADGLAAAHEKGIVHRDIKPENIMIRKDGIAQIMDFGLAKLRASGSKITRLTKEGSTIGTAGYMSPEQVQGQETDHRSDIFSYGVVLFELLTGQLPFKGVHETALAYEIVNVDPPPMSSIKPEIDPNLDAIVLECLEKDPRERTQSIAQISIDLKRYRRESSRQRVSRITAARPAIKAEGTSQPESISGSLIQKYLGYVLAGILALVVIFLLWKNGRGEHQAASSPMRFSIDLSSSNPLYWSQAQSGLSVSPDGKSFVYTAQITNTSQLFLHKMDQLSSEPILGTENSVDPAFSPDGQWVVYNSARDKLVKTSIFGGAPETICPTTSQTRGVWWAEDHNIYYGNISGSIYRVSENGGTPEPVTKLDSSAGEISHRFPELLPGAKTLVFTIKSNNITSYDDAIIAAERIGTGERKVLIRGGTYARYLPNGHLTYLRGNTIFAVPFDADRLEVTGPPVPVEEGGWVNPGSGQANLSFSKDGLLVFAPSGPLSFGRYSLNWMDRQGHLSTLLDTLRPYFSARISPDGQKIAADINAANDDIWLYQISRGTLTRLTFAGGNNNYPIWAPGGNSVIYSAERNGPPNLFRKPWDGSGAEERLTTKNSAQRPESFSPDGKLLAFDETSDIWILPLEGDRKAYPFIHTQADEVSGIFSPDGKWMAYVSNESGKFEVYVTSFPKREGNWQVSNGGGTEPIWSRDGKELFYSNGSSLMAVNVSAGSGFDYTVPRKLCAIPPYTLVWDIAQDGKKFLVRVAQSEQITLLRLEVVTDWFDEVKAKVKGEGH